MLSCSAVNSSEHVASYFQDRLDDVRFVEEDLTKKGIKRRLEGTSGQRSICSKRRTRSYMSYRIPRRVKVRQLKSEASSSNTPPKLRETRKQRRKPSVLRTKRLKSSGRVDGAGEETPRWLDTHRWHTKRMHMQVAWGFKISRTSMTRGKRAVGRHLKRGAVIQDVSFLSPYLLHSLPLTRLKDILLQFMDPSEVDFLSEAAILGGKAEYECVLYKRRSYPRCCVGPVRVCFVAGSVGSERVKLMLWCHPAVAADMFSDLKEAITDLIGSGDDYSKYCCEVPGLSRFSLRGARSQAALSQVFWPVSSAGDACGHAEAFIRLMESEGIDNMWGNGVVFNMEAMDVRQLTIKGMLSESLFSPDPAQPWIKVNKKQWSKAIKAKDSASCIRDKRTRLGNIPSTNGLHMPDRKTSQKYSDEALNIRRYEARKAHLSDNSINVKNRSPQSSQDWIEYSHGQTFDRIPVLLIRRTCKSWRDLPKYHELFDDQKKARGAQRGNLELSGWDVVIPSVWSNAVWKAFQFAGAVAIGLEEAEVMSLESGVASFPRDFPDSSAGIKYWEDKKRSVQIEIMKMPKRDTPFCRNKQSSVLEFSCLFQGGATTFNDYSLGMAVVRSAVFLQPFIPAPFCTKLIKKEPAWKSLLRNSNSVLTPNVEDIAPPVDLKTFPFPSMPFPTLISVFLRGISRGTICAGASIYRPLHKDIIAWQHFRFNKRQKNTGGGKRIGEWRGVEIPQIDICERQLMGYVTSGQSSITSAGEMGIGFCGAVQVYECLSNVSENMAASTLTHIVLIKCPGSKWLRPAEINLLLVIV